MHIDHRLELINEWLPTVIGTTDFTINSASSDASFRRYFRVGIEDKTWIVMDAPPTHEDIKPFITIARFLYHHDIHVPKIDAVNHESGFLLLSDFGHKAYLDELNESSAETLYQSAIDSLLKIQQCPIDNDINLPAYDRSLLQRELMLFPDWYLSKHLHAAIPDFLPNTFELLINNALEQPQVIVHRDFHSRNLMHTADNSPGIIDFQDAVVGPITYDLVSLLRDCYISWPQTTIDHWIQYYFNKAQRLDLLTDISIQQFTQWFDLMGLQRHLKVLGIFSRLNYRDNKANYLNDLPLTLHYVQKVSAKYPEFEELSDFLKQHPPITAVS
ncbi:MAG: phosphotransferase [Proteobacteria bacterium]|nr:phosphotransferase [Pseudomonadota bacterium]